MNLEDLNQSRNKTETMALEAIITPAMESSKFCFIGIVNANKCVASRQSRSLKQALPAISTDRENSGFSM